MTKNHILWLGRKSILLSMIGMADRKCVKSTTEEEMWMLCFFEEEGH